MTFWQKTSVSLLSVVWFTLVLFALLGLGVLHVLPWWLLLGLALFGVLVGAVPFLLRWLVKRNTPEWNGKFSFATFALAGMLLVAGLASLPVFYAAYMVDSGPTSIPLATLSNGKKTVVFQGMQHVGSEGFYKGVVFDLEKALTDGYTLFYEGVQPAPGKPEIDDWFFKEFMGASAGLNASYQQFAKQCGMAFQLGYFEPLLADKAINPKKHITADVSTADLRTEYERLMREDAAFAAYVNTPRPKVDPMKTDPMISALGVLGTSTPAQQKLGGILCRGVLAISMGQEADVLEPKEKLILLYRNRALARFVADSKAEKIYITYGAKHFRGFVQDLKALDPAFEIVALSWGRAMSNPRDIKPPEGDWSSLMRPARK